MVTPRWQRTPRPRTTMLIPIDLGTAWDAAGDCSGGGDVTATLRLPRLLAYRSRRSLEPPQRASSLASSMATIAV